MKRTALKFIVYLLCGAILTIAVAWMCAAWVNPFPAGSQFSITRWGSDREFGVSAAAGFGHTRLSVHQVSTQMDGADFTYDFLSPTPFRFIHDGERYSEH